MARWESSDRLWGCLETRLGFQDEQHETKTILKNDIIWLNDGISN